MKNFVMCTLFLTLFSASFAFAQDVVVEGPRIPGAGTNPPVGAGGTPIATDPPKCSDPSCGGSVDKKEPGESDGSAPVTSADKAKQNKEAIEKAKKWGELALEKAKQALEKVVDKIAKALEINVNDVEARRVDTVGPDGSSKSEIDCKSLVVGDRENPCVKILTAPKMIVLPSGKILNQLEVTTVVLDRCYFDGGCPRKTMSFIVGSETEYDSFVSKL